ncbi:MAG: hypothetical protein LBU73_00355 [Helicobacteraceae bacterium]|nr:hypothetical protein [Helicobacteraceae bacterium]
MNFAQIACDLYCGSNGVAPRSILAITIFVYDRALKFGFKSYEVKMKPINPIAITASVYVGAITL